MSRILQSKSVLVRNVRTGIVPQRLKDYFNSFKWVEKIKSSKFATNWREAPENFKRTRKMILVSGVSVFYLCHQAPFYACLPPKPQMPKPNEDGTYSQEVLESLTAYQKEEYQNSLGPNWFMPNRYRCWVADQRMKQGWAVKWHFCKEWWNELTQPEYALLLPEKLDSQPKVTVSFELALLLESDFDVMSGWRFRLRPGAKRFLFELSKVDCELVVYTVWDQFQMLPMADRLLSKFNGLLHVGENCQVYSDHGVNYKLFKNSCRFVDGDYQKALSQMNRDLAQVIHLDTRRESVEPQCVDNCLFVSDVAHLPESDQLIALTRRVLDILSVQPNDVREAIKTLSHSSMKPENQVINEVL